MSFKADEWEHNLLCDHLANEENQTKNKLDLEVISFSFLRKVRVIVFGGKPVQQGFESV